MSLPASAELIEVCPRDGFQNVREPIPTEGKIAIIQKLAQAGFRRMEVTSFVSPKAVPQMADGPEVLEAVRETLHACGMESVALVPNARGVETAAAHHVDEVTYVISVSAAHNQMNVKRTPEESMEQFRDLIREYGSRVTFRLGLATALGCPFGEPVTLEKVLEMTDFGLELGSREITISDTLGMSNPVHTHQVLQALVDRFGPEPFVMHLHDTQGMALANTLAALSLGIRKFEAAAGGLGGCPFAPGAAGNVATEDVLNMLDGMGIAAGVDRGRLLEVIPLIQQYVRAPIVSHTAFLPAFSREKK